MKLMMRNNPIFFWSETNNKDARLINKYFTIRITIA